VGRSDKAKVKKILNNSSIVFPLLIQKKSHLTATRNNGALEIVEI